VIGRYAATYIDRDAAEGDGGIVCAADHPLFECQLHPNMARPGTYAELSVWSRDVRYEWPLVPVQKADNTWHCRDQICLIVRVSLADQHEEG
jgi:hypothetical protein